MHIVPCDIKAGYRDTYRAVISKLATVIHIALCDIKAGYRDTHRAV